MADDAATEAGGLGFNGLARAEPSLPVSWYSDPGQHAREMAAIWRTSWLAFCRADQLAAPLDRVAGRIAGVNAVVVRDREGGLKAFHNICRHRGAELCPEGAGRLAKPLMVCAYHAWAYDLAGRLVATGMARGVEGFDRAEHGLLPLGVAEWGGLVFVNAAGGGQAEFEAEIGPELAPLANWPLAELEPAHVETLEVACNWKVFWENYNECLHCPGVHPELSALVPIYGRGIMVREDDPAWRDRGESDDPRFSGRLRAGADSWTADGRAAWPAFPGLSEADRLRGHTYATVLPSFFVVGHVDHARTVRVTPLGPERTLLEATWLTPAGRSAGPGFDLEQLTGMARRVLAEDAAACELNQRGLRDAPFEHGVLMQEEYELHAFQQWVKARLGEGPAPEGSRAGRWGW